MPAFPSGNKTLNDLQWLDGYSGQSTLELTALENAYSVEYDDNSIQQETIALPGNMSFVLRIHNNPNQG
jgi:hypothetical protein